MKYTNALDLIAWRLFGPSTVIGSRASLVVMRMQCRCGLIISHPREARCGK